jgi:hypothetical protein
MVYVLSVGTIGVADSRAVETNQYSARKYGRAYMEAQEGADEKADGGD